MAQLKITLTRSAVHRLPKQRKIVKELGLGRISSSVIKPDTPLLVVRSSRSLIWYP